jgi:hypothetical protein
MDGTRNHNAKQNKTDSERQILNIFFHVQNLDFRKKYESRKLFIFKFMIIKLHISKSSFVYVYIDRERKNTFRQINLM